MPRAIKINPSVIEFGKTAINYKSRSIAAWTFWYHKPYQLDWAEARKKAQEKLWTIGVNDDKDYYQMMREKATDKLRMAMRH